MTREIFLALESYLSATQPALELIDLDLGQYQDGEDAVRATPAAYIRFNAVDWMTLNRFTQRGVMDFDVTLVSQSAYGDKSDITDVTYINHLAIERNLYKYLQGKRFTISDVPGVTLEDGDDDVVICESIDRISSTPHDTQDALVVTSQRFRATIFDYSANPDYERVTAGLQLTINIVETI